MNHHHHLILRTPLIMAIASTTTFSKSLSLMRSIRSISSSSIVCFCSSAVNLSNGDGGISMVQGASRGIGLEFVKQLLGRNEKGHVIATCRNPDKAIGLLELKKQFPEHLHIQQLDVTDERTIEASANSIRERYGFLNLLINASGILSIPNVLQPETTLSKVQKSSLLLAYEVNAVGPIMVIKHMWPLLKAGKGFGTGQDFAVVANISARVGSIGDNRLGGWHSYRSSKSALNQLTKTLSVEFARRKDAIICILLHPGTVDTDLSKPFQKNVPQEKLFTKEYSVQKLLGIINNVNSTDNGKFFAWDGQEIPW
ncbi:C-factor [Thalictrum thalictroides]|uniref:C-factor n=1 Tax=Thalictrum thalictroides TaxID=46969 RepID=A0A7J6W1R0_THATH|nr:C-factor [Thalictrum thalictroides]